MMERQRQRQKKRYKGMSLQFCTLLQRLIDLQRGGGAPSQPAHAHMKICTLNTVKHQKTQTQKHDVQVSCL